jgi:hypothetical protein
MNNFVKIVFLLFLFPCISNAGNYLLIKKGNSIYLPSGCKFCSDNIIVEEGASFITEDSLGICDNDIITRLGKTLPSAELISFTAHIDEQKNVLLKWETKNGFGYQVYEIERSDSDKSGFERIGIVTANGNTNYKRNYSYVDKMIQLNKNYYYRIKQINMDSSFSILNTIKVALPSQSNFYLSQNYPNPFNPTTKIKYKIPSTNQEESRNLNVQLKIYDLLGREIKTLINKEQPPGEYEIELNCAELSSGIYFYKLKAGNFIQTKKMILLR